MQQTSLFAYNSIENLSDKRRKVYEAIQSLGEACNLDIADYLGWEINRVTGRVNEIVKQGLVIESKRDISRTGRTAIYWRIK